MRFWNNLHQVRSKFKMESQIISSFGSNNIKRPKQDSQHRSRSPVIEGGEPSFITVFTVFRLLTDFVCLYTYEF